MKTFILILVAVSLSFGTMIGDFAPTKIGTKWKYSYRREGPENDSLIIDIYVMGKVMRGLDTLIILNCKEQGRTSSNISNNMYDSIGTTILIDTAIISSDSIHQAAGYQCRIFPFAATHAIDSAIYSTYYNLGKTISGNESLYFWMAIIGGTTHITEFMYLQGVGEYSYFRTYSSSTLLKFDLISFNGKSMPTGVIQSAKVESPKGVGYSSFVKAVSLSANARLTMPAYSLTGQRLHVGDRFPRGIVIINKAEMK